MAHHRSTTKNIQEDSHKKPWAEAKAAGQTKCFYCFGRFTHKNPPTFDHIIPKSKGGTFLQGKVIACALCNGARGEAEFNSYMRAVEWEWRQCKLEHRPYRRPKRRNCPVTADTPLGYLVTSMSKRQWRERNRNLIHDN